MAEGFDFCPGASNQRTNHPAAHRRDASHPRHSGSTRQIKEHGLRVVVEVVRRCNLSLWKICCQPFKQLVSLLTGIQLHRLPLLGSVGGNILGFDR